MLEKSCLWRHSNRVFGAAGIAAALLASSIPAFAAGFNSEASAAPVPPALVPMVSETAPVHRQVRVAQAADPRVLTLEEQVRSLSGQVEELNFLLLQMQEQLRKMQEDNEFRFQQIEGGRATGETPDKSETLPEASPQPGITERAAGAGERQLGEPPRNLGTIKLNPDGSVREVTLGEPMDLRGEAPGGTGDETTVAALPETNDPEELYGNSYEFILSGDYRTAEAGFRQHIELFPDDPRTADARYWLGESLLSQERYAEAAEVFLASSRDFPDSRKAPEMLLKLGVSLSAMNQRDIACATFKEVGDRYPNASAALQEKVRQEAMVAGC